jgi:hypothetical protein
MPFLPEDQAWPASCNAKMMLDGIDVDVADHSSQTVLNGGFAEKGPHMWLYVSAKNAAQFSYSVFP